MSSPKHQEKMSKAELAQRVLTDMLVEASTGRFYGTLTLSLVVQDGRIQYLQTSREETIR